MVDSTPVTAVTTLSLSSVNTSKIEAPAMTYIKGEEMSEVVMDMVQNQWIDPYVNTSKWEFFDLSVKNRDTTGDQVLKDAIDSGKKTCAIHKNPTITPDEKQSKKMGLQTTLSSPNGKMRTAWNGYTINRDTIFIPDFQAPNFEFGYKNPVLFNRHAVGGEYSAGSKIVGAGKAVTMFYPDDGSEPVLVDQRSLTDKVNALVTYNNPYDNVKELAQNFFSRCLETGVTPYVVTKKTVFKWQEPFWQMMEKEFNDNWKDKFNEKDLLKDTGGELRHLLSDDGIMKLIEYKNGNFGMVAHNYDGDIFTDGQGKVYGSPALISSTLFGIREDGIPIKEFEASHGTGGSDQYPKYLKGEKTSFNPLGMVDALIGAMNHSAHLAGKEKEVEMNKFTTALRDALYDTMRAGILTTDMDKKAGVTTEEFIDAVAKKLAELKNLGRFGAEGQALNG